MKVKNKSIMSCTVIVAAMLFCIAFVLACTGGTPEVPGTTPVNRVTIAGNPAITLTPGASHTFTAETGPDDADDRGVTWSIVGADAGATIAEVSGAGVLTTANAGSFTVRATAASGVFAAVAVTVAPAPGDVSISIDQGAAVDLAYPNNLSLSATVTPGNVSQNVVWSIYGNPQGSWIDSQSGSFTPGRANGPITVRATWAGNSTVFSSILINIAVPVTSVVIDEGSDFRLAVGSTYQFSAAAMPVEAANRNLEWAIVGNSLGSHITNAGYFTAGESVGIVTLRARSAANEAINSTIDVYIAEQSIAIDGPATMFIEVGDTHTFEAAVLPVDEGEIVWSVLGSPQSGINTATGLFTAGNINETVVVRASLMGDSAVFNDVVVNVIIILEEVTITDRPNEEYDFGEGYVYLVPAGGVHAFDVEFYPLNAANQNVSWSIVGNGAGSAIHPVTGALHAGTSGAEFTVRATRAAVGGIDPVIIDEIDVVVVVDVTSVTIIGGDAMVEISTYRDFSAAVGPDTATFRTVAWSIVGEAHGSHINADTGRFTAGTIYDEDVTVRATVFNPFGSDHTVDITVSIIEEYVLLTGLTILPPGGLTIEGNATTITGGTAAESPTINFSFEVDFVPVNATTTAVIWSIISADDNHFGTSVNAATGQFNRGTQENVTVTLRVTSVIYPTVYRDLTINIVPPYRPLTAVGIAERGEFMVYVGAAYHDFTATVNPINATYQDVTWSMVTPAEDALGATIDAYGRFVPGNETGTVRIRVEATHIGYNVFLELDVVIIGHRYVYFVDAGADAGITTTVATRNTTLDQPLGTSSWGWTTSGAGNAVISAQQNSPTATSTERVRRATNSHSLMYTFALTPGVAYTLDLEMRNQTGAANAFRVIINGFYYAGVTAGGGADAQPANTASVANNTTWTARYHIVAPANGIVTVEIRSVSNTADNPTNQILQISTIRIREHVGFMERVGLNTDLATGGIVGNATTPSGQEHVFRLPVPAAGTYRVSVLLDQDESNGWASGRYFITANSVTHVTNAGRLAGTGVHNAGWGGANNPDNARRLRAHEFSVTATEIADTPGQYEVVFSIWVRHHDGGNSNPLGVSSFVVFQI